MKWHIALGTVSIVAVVVILSIVAVSEQDRMASFTSSYHSRQIEFGAALFDKLCDTCHGPQGRGIDGLAPAINAADLFNGERLANIGFAGSLEDYLNGVISSGRPVPSQGTNYPQRMPTWGQENGGPLRSDEIQALVAYIMNWEEVALAGGEGGTAAPPSGDMVGTDIQVSLPSGDPDRGQALAEGALGCVSCHALTTVGPAWAPEGTVPGIGERATTRFTQSDYTGNATTPEEYLIESIVLPNVYIVEGYQPNIMVGNFGDRISLQDMADLLAYLQSIR